MKKWNGFCQRCGHETRLHIMSTMNTQEICLDCKEEEEKLPDYQKARKAEEDAVKNGNLNFEGGNHDL